MAVTIPPAWEIAVATAPTIPWSGAVCRRIVIEYDDVVTAMPATLSRARGYGQVVRQPASAASTSSASLAGSVVGA